MPIHIGSCKCARGDVIIESVMDLPDLNSELYTAAIMAISTAVFELVDTGAIPPICWCGSAVQSWTVSVRISAEQDTNEALLAILKRKRLTAQVRWIARDN